MFSISTIICQPHHHVREHMNSRVKTPSGAKPFSCKYILSGFRGRRSRVSVSAGSGLDLQELLTAARARFALQDVKAHIQSTFGRYRAAKCAPDFSESSICTSKCEKIVTFGALLEIRPAKSRFECEDVKKLSRLEHLEDKVGKRCTTRDCSESSSSHKKRKKLWGAA